MKTHLIQIGNSRGIRIPKAFLEQANLENGVELSISGENLVLAPVAEPRKGWAEAFRDMAKTQDDILLDESPVLSEWDDLEWEW